MKVTINRKENKNCGFPKLMIDKSNGVIILAVSQFAYNVSGFNLHVGSANWAIGQFSKEYDSRDFIDFNGSITLENGEN